MIILSKMPGSPLPKRLLRPFNYYESPVLNDKQYKIPAGHNLNEVFASIWVLPAVAAIWMFISWLVMEDNTTLYLFLLALSITLIFILFSKILKPKKFMIFDRETGMVTIPRVFSSRPRVYAPWSAFAGRVILTSSKVGAARHELLLMHIPESKGWFLDASILDVYSVLGFWSFLVQYMDKSKPLPNVPELQQYGPTSNGLGTWKEWDTIEQSKGFIDPYYDWLSEVKRNPELDEVNHLIEQRVLGKA